MRVPNVMHARFAACRQLATAVLLADVCMQDSAGADSGFELTWRDNSLQCCKK